MHILTPTHQPAFPKVPMVMINVIQSARSVKRHVRQRAHPASLILTLFLSCSGIQEGTFFIQFARYGLEVEGEVVADEAADVGVFVVADKRSGVAGGGSVDVYVDGCCGLGLSVNGIRGWEVGREEGLKRN